MLFCSGVCSAGAEDVGLAASGGLSGALCAPLAGASSARARTAVTPSEIFTEHPFRLRNELLRDGKRSAKPQVSCRDLKSRRRLFALVFIAINVQRDVLHQLQIEAIAIGNLLWALQILNIQLQDAIQDVVRRQTVLVLLIGP